MQKFPYTFLDNISKDDNGLKMQNIVNRDTAFIDDTELIELVKIL